MDPGLFVLIFMFVIFYLLLIRPQQQRAKAQRALLGSLGTGDRVVTIGGLHGTIVSLDDDTVLLDIAPGTTVTFARQAIARRLVDADESEIEDVDELDELDGLDE
jgi:preprotein translocase subunit YajC